MGCCSLARCVAGNNVPFSVTLELHSCSGAGDNIALCRNNNGGIKAPYDLMGA